MDKIELLQKYIDECDNIVFFGGAGVSTESGIKDFRSKDGLYNETYNYPPETILSHSFFINNTSEFYKFYRDKMNCLEALPNITHNYLVQLENKGKLKAIVTQNIDGLHTKAGNEIVYELHGSVYRNYCTYCNKSYDANYIFNSIDIPKCECGNLVKPDVVLYEEPLDNNIIINSINAIKNAQLLIVAGTSLTVYPASSFIDYFDGKYLVIINRDKTSKDNKANLVINKSLNEVFSKLK